MTDSEKIDKIIQMIGDFKNENRIELNALKKICTTNTQNQKELEGKIESQNRTISNLQREIRKKNLILIGLQETENSQAGLEDIVIKFFNEKLNVGCKTEEIDEIFRLGKNMNKSRPIKVCFTTMKRRNIVLNNRKLIFGTNIYIREDLPFQIRQERAQRFQAQKAVTTEEPTPPYSQYDDKGNKRMQANSPEQLEEAMKQDKKQKCISNSQGQFEVNKSTLFAVSTPNKKLDATNKDAGKESGTNSKSLRPAGSSKNPLS